MTALFERLRHRLTQGHARPLDDLLSDARFDRVAHPRAAAVLIAVTDRDRPGALLIHRPQSMRSHPGQVAFPGGQIDAGEDAVAAALREAEEELGVTPAAVRVVGATDPYHTGTGFHVTPVLGVVPPDLSLRPNPAEVDRWFEAPLDVLLDSRNHLPQSTVWRGERRDYLAIDWQGHRIWGVTAAIIANLSRRLAWMEETSA